MAEKCSMRVTFKLEKYAILDDVIKSPLHRAYTGDSTHMEGTPCVFSIYLELIFCQCLPNR